MASERVAIVGSRAHPDIGIVAEYVASLAKSTVIVSGGAKGVDEAAAAVGRGRGLQVIVYEPDRQYAFTNSKTKPRRIDVSYRDRLLYRNTLIALECTRMVVFPDGSKGGCWDAAREALRFRRPVELRWADGRVEEYLRAGREEDAARAVTGYPIPRDTHRQTSAEGESDTRATPRPLLTRAPSASPRSPRT